MSHIRHILSIETTDIKRGQASTVSEHPLHIRHILSIETTDIKRGQASTAPEHNAHICHILSIKILYSLDGL